MTGALVFVTVEDCEAMPMATRRSGRRFSLVPGRRCLLIPFLLFSLFFILPSLPGWLWPGLKAKIKGSKDRLERLSDHRIIRSNTEVSYTTKLLSVGSSLTVLSQDWALIKVRHSRASKSALATTTQGTSSTLESSGKYSAL